MTFFTTPETIVSVEWESSSAILNFLPKNRWPSSSAAWILQPRLQGHYFGGARSKGFATLRNVSKLPFFDKIGQAKSVGFRFYSAIWRSESRISSRYLEITSISLIYSLNFLRKKESLFWLSRGLNRLTCVTRRIRGDSKSRDYPNALLGPNVVRHMKNSYEIMH